EQLHLRCSASEEGHEDLSEGHIDCRKGLSEQVARSEIDLPNRRSQRLDGLHEVVALCAQKRLSLLELLMLVDGQDVHRTDLLDLLCELRHVRLQSGPGLLI